jgi:hypothetical protein
MLWGILCVSFGVKNKGVNTPFILYIQLYTVIKLYIMQELIDNDLREILTREEELMMMENKELIKHILILEREYYANQKDNEELPW